MSIVLPKMIAIRQKFAAPRIDDIRTNVVNELDKILLGTEEIKGKRIAITVGSRGIANLQTIVKTIVQYLLNKGAEPFIVPAMGSHGGATAEGQVKVLADLGINENDIGVPILSLMDVEKIGITASGINVYFDKNALQADAIFVLNRIKPHTGFTAPNESGLMKMIAVGLGKHKGCIEMHNKGLAVSIGEAANLAIKKTPIKYGLAIVENQYDETAKIIAMDVKDIESIDSQLLIEAKRLMPSLPVRDIDVLIVDEMGKNISGTGMDVHVIGRMHKLGMCEPDYPCIKRIVVRDLTAASHGNALGMGLADLITKRLADKIDLKSTYENVLSASVLQRGKMPIIIESDYKLILTALKSISGLDMSKARVVRIKNTLEVGTLLVSETIREELSNNKNIEIISESREMKFDATGNLL